MSFRTLIVMNRILAPVTFAITVVGFLLISGSTNPFFIAIAFAPFIVTCVCGAWLGLRFQRYVVVPMRCPFCGDLGIVGRGVTFKVGWWLRCQDCGIVKPRGLLGLRFTKQPVDDENN